MVVQSLSGGSADNIINAVDLNELFAQNATKDQSDIGKIEFKAGNDDTIASEVTDNNENDDHDVDDIKSFGTSDKDIPEIFGENSATTTITSENDIEEDYTISIDDNNRPTNRPKDDLNEIGNIAKQKDDSIEAVEGQADTNKEEGNYDGAAFYNDDTEDDDYTEVLGDEGSVTSSPFDTGDMDDVTLVATSTTTTKPTAASTIEEVRGVTVAAGSSRTTSTVFTTSVSGNGIRTTTAIDGSTTTAGVYDSAIAAGVDDGVTDVGVDSVTAAGVVGSVTTAIDGSVTTAGVDDVATDAGNDASITAERVDGSVTTAKVDGSATAAGVDYGVADAVVDDSVTAASVDGSVTAAGVDGSVTAVEVDRTETASGVDGSAAAVGFDVSATAVRGDGGVTAAGVDSTTTATGAEDSVTAAGFDGSVTDAGFEDSVTAVGVDGSKTTAGVDDSVIGAGVDDTSTARVDDSITAARVDDSPTGAQVDESVTAAGVDDTVTAAGVDESIRVAGVDDSVTAAGVHGSVTAEGVYDGVTDEGVDDSVIAAIVDVSTTAAGIDNSETVAGVDGTITAARVEDSVTAAGVDDSKTDAGVDDTTTAAEIDVTTTAAGVDRSTEVAEDGKSSTAVFNASNTNIAEDDIRTTVAWSTTESAAVSRTTDATDVRSSSESADFISTTESAEVSRTTESAAVSRTTESVTVSRTTESVTVSSTTESAAVSSTTETAAASSATESVAGSSTTELPAASSTTESAAVGSTTESAAVSSTMESAIVSRPTAAASLSSISQPSTSTPSPLATTTTSISSSSLNSPSSHSGVVIIEPKNRVQAQLVACLGAIQCVEPVACMFAQSKCLQLSNLEDLPARSRQSLAECKVDSLLCSLEASTLAGQMACEKMYRECAGELGVGIAGDRLSYEDKEKESEVFKDNAEEADESGDNLDESEQFDEDDGDVLNENASDTTENPNLILNLPSLGLSVSVADINDDQVGLSNDVIPEENIVKDDQASTSNDNAGLKTAETPVNEFGITFPDFGFNISVARDPSQCAVGSTLYEDFDLVPTDDPCQVCQCVVGKVECYRKACKLPSAALAITCTMVKVPGVCCPTYKCAEDNNSAVLDKETNKTKETSVIDDFETIATTIIDDTFVKESIDDFKEAQSGNNLTGSFDGGQSSKEEGVPLNIDDAKDILMDVKTSIMDIFANSFSNAINQTDELEGEATTDGSDIAFENTTAPAFNKEEKDDDTTSEDDDSLNSQTTFSTPEQTTTSVENNEGPATKISNTNIIDTPNNLSTPQETKSSEDTVKNNTDEGDTGDFEVSVNEPQINGEIEEDKPKTSSSDDDTAEESGSIRDNQSNIADIGETTTPFVGTLIDEKTNQSVLEKQSKIPVVESTTLPSTKDAVNKQSVGEDENDGGISQAVIENIKEPLISKESDDGQNDTIVSSEEKDGQSSVEVIGDKDVRVFLNFTWKGDNFQIEDVFTNTANEFQGNITDTLMRVLNHGVGYVIIPEGQLPEIEDDMSVEIVQTIALDYRDNVDIVTHIVGLDSDNLHPADKLFIANIEDKTKAIVHDIFDNMGDELMPSTILPPTIIDQTPLFDDEGFEGGPQTISNDAAPEDLDAQEDLTTTHSSLHLANISRPGQNNDDSASGEDLESAKGEAGKNSGQDGVNADNNDDTAISTEDIPANNDDNSSTLQISLNSDDEGVKITTHTQLESKENRPGEGAEAATESLDGDDDYENITASSSETPNKASDAPTDSPNPSQTQTDTTGSDSLGKLDTAAFKTEETGDSVDVTNIDYLDTEATTLVIPFVSDESNDFATETTTTTTTTNESSLLNGVEGVKTAESFEKNLTGLIGDTADKEVDKRVTNTDNESELVDTAALFTQQTGWSNICGSHKKIACFLSVLH